MKKRLDTKTDGVILFLKKLKFNHNLEHYKLQHTSGNLSFCTYFLLVNLKACSCFNFKEKVKSSQSTKTNDNELSSVSQLTGSLTNARNSFAYRINFNTKTINFAVIIGLLVLSLDTL